MSYEIVNPVELGAPRGWNNGMLAPGGGRVLLVAGQIGVGGGDEGVEAGPGEPGVGRARDSGRREEGEAGREPAGDGRGRAGAGAELAVQFRAALAKVVAVVKAAGGQIADVGRLTIYVTNMEAYRGSPAEVGAAYRAVFGKHFPAMALVAVTELVDPRAVVEVEATAVIPQAQPGGRPAMDSPTAKEQP